MGETVKLTADDGHNFDAYVARPDGQPKAGLVIVQEIFGVNVHMRGVADDYAAQGYLAVAPALFDRVKPGIELGYDSDDVAEGRGRSDDALDHAGQHVTGHLVAGLVADGITADHFRRGPA